jgi:exodeoxyribonuclease VII small subunit
MTEEIKFEKALERLEKIVEELEAGNIPLEEALKKYEEGVKLSRVCGEKLAQAEKKIQVLTKTLDGTLKRENFELEEKE